MGGRFFRAVALVTAAGVALSACAQLPGEGDQQTANHDETVATGAIAGALLGALLGAVADPKNRGRGAAIGAAAGGALGAGSGYYVASQNDRYANQEQALNARIRAARKEAANYREIAESSERLAEQNRQKIAGLQRRFESGQITAAQYRQALAPIQNDLALMRNASAESAKVRAKVAEDAQRLRNSGRQNAALEQSAEELRRAQQRLDQNASDLVKALAVAPAA